MKKIALLELFFWTFRRNEKDVVNLYDSLSDLMRLVTGGDMLNFGFWNEKTSTPLLAQKNLCDVFGKMALLDTNQKIIDVGSGLASPALQWHNQYNIKEITCVDINSEQLKNSQSSISKNNFKKYFNFLNANATTLPFENESVDRILALESAQHFKPLKNFFSESFRILKRDGMLILAIPVLVDSQKSSITKLGILSMTWPSEHYSVDFVKSLLEKEGFHINDFQKIGSNVYEPLANYYLKNRESLKNKILEKYPSYVEKILYKSIQKMKHVSQKKIIDYVLISCQK